jgi:hypothetical protein
LGGKFYELGNADDNKRIVRFEEKEFVMNVPMELEINL